MELQKGKGTSCFFPIITLYLLGGVMLAVVCPYAILRGSFMGGVTLIMLGYHSFSVFAFCHLGQAFINKVRRLWSHWVFGLSLSVV